MKGTMMHNIRIGTLVQGTGDVSGYIRKILPYGFESVSITWWQEFRDAPPSKIADEVRRTAEENGVKVSSISPFGNALEYDAAGETTRKNFEEAIDRAADFGTDLVTGFSGRLRGKSVPECIERMKEVWTPLLERAASKNVRIAFENCNMGGNWNSGDWNIAINPDAWELIFDALPAENLGLQWEPCHQMTLLIDPMPQIREWGHRFFNIHGKDATIRHDIIAKHGFGGRECPVWHRTPGFGDSDWTVIISELRLVGFTGSIDIEGWHDPVYRDALEMTGQVHALNYLKKCRGGDIISI